MRRSPRRALVAVFAAVGVAPGALAQWNDGASDLPNVPFGTPIVPITTPGTTHVAFGTILTGQTDIDFISILVNFATPTLIVDLDTGNLSQNSLLGIAPFNQYPTLMVNDDDNDGPDDFAGVQVFPRDSAFNVTGFLAAPVNGGTLFTIAITRSGDTNWVGTNLDLGKLEWHLYVTAVPTPGAAMLAACAGMLGMRRRRARG